MIRKGKAGGAGRIRTGDLRFRKPLLSPAELQPLVGIIPLFFLLDNAVQLHFR